ncbi:MAG: hypothetical protein IID39_02000 [Planctomycetes bacterium]|nr:hypothetical protein [Planctomycetota bacterium]
MGSPPEFGIGAREAFRGTLKHDALAPSSDKATCDQLRQLKPHMRPATLKWTTARQRQHHDGAHKCVTNATTQAASAMIDRLFADDEVKKKVEGV